MVALVLFALGALFAIAEGIEKLREPHDLTRAGWAIGVLVVAIVLESFSLRTAVREANVVRGSEDWWSFVRHSKSPELPVVLLEDVGALVGLAFALAGVGLAIATGEPRFDALGSIAIGVLLAGIAVVLAKEMKSLLIGESAAPGVTAAIRAALERLRRCGASSICARSISVPKTCWWRPRSSSTRACASPTSRARSTPPRHACASRCPRRA